MTRLHFPALWIGVFFFAVMAFAQDGVPKAENGEGAKPAAVVNAEAMKPVADVACAELGIKPRPVLSAPLGKTTPSGWFDDWNRASSEAKRTNRPILVLFTGSDWCQWCKVLHEEVLSKPDFKHFADEKLILVYMDEPSKTELPLILQRTHEQLRRLLTPGDGVPATVVLSPNCERWKCISGYEENYVEVLKELLKKHGF